MTRPSSQTQLLAALRAACDASGGAVALSLAEVYRLVPEVEPSKVRAALRALRERGEILTRAADREATVYRMPGGAR